AVSLSRGCAVLGRKGLNAVCLGACPAALPDAAGAGDVLATFGADDALTALSAAASAAGLKTVAFTGLGGEALAESADLRFFVDSGCPSEVADICFIAFHAVIRTVRETLKDEWGLEVIFPPDGHDFKFALFDFDGTLSLIREGWQKIMIPYFCEELVKAPGAADETPEEIERCVTEFVDMLTGKQTIYQCMALADEIKKRGGTPLDPMDYKAEYIRRLMEKIHDRREGLRSGEIDPETLLVRGSCKLLQTLLDNGIRLYCASGTDQPQVREEAALLGMDRYFGENIYGALDEHATACTKELVIRRLLAENDLDGSELLSFGDGFVEIELVSRIGGYPIAVATDEARKCGIDEWKRQRLVGAGAGAVIPDFEEAQKIVDFILQK
ncbi:MAG: HAD hydrolase-like protein, partial [Oscillospiraceae bacterium]|nr:HAD hydrolase-like protein [Oscillospiraceae bacterium]